MSMTDRREEEGKKYEKFEQKFSSLFRFPIRLDFVFSEKMCSKLVSLTRKTQPYTKV